jgi:heme/copper-type cytochrome/quinol oxidase subunit 3
MKDKLKRFMDSTPGMLVFYLAEIAIFAVLVGYGYNYFTEKWFAGMTAAQYHQGIHLFNEIDKPDSIVFRKTLLLLFGSLAGVGLVASMHLISFFHDLDKKKLKKRILELEAYQE